MWDGVGIGSTKGKGLSGFIEHSKAKLPGGGATQKAKANRPPPPSQRSLRETDLAKSALAEHLARRKIKVELAELEEKMRKQQGEDGKPVFTTSQIRASIQSLAVQRQKELVARKAAAKKAKAHATTRSRENEDKKDLGGGEEDEGEEKGLPSHSGGPKSAGKFAQAFGISGAADSGDPSSVGAGGAFDQDARRVFKAERKVARWKHMEERAEAKVVERLLKEQEEGGAGSEPHQQGAGTRKRGRARDEL